MSAFDSCTTTDDSVRFALFYMSPKTQRVVMNLSRKTKKQQHQKERNKSEKLFLHCYNLVGASNAGFKDLKYFNLKDDTEWEFILDSK